MLPLSRLPLGKTARILSLSAQEPLRGRLLDLGFVPEGEITPLYAAQPRLVKNNVFRQSDFYLLLWSSATTPSWKASRRRSRSSISTGKAAWTTASPARTI